MAQSGKHFNEKPESSPAGHPSARVRDQQQLDFELDFFEGVLSRCPDYVDVLRIMGNLLTLKGRFADGLQIDKRLVQLRPNDALAHYNLACSFALLKRAQTPHMHAREARQRLLAGFETLSEGLKELKLHRARRDDFLRREIDGTTRELRRLSLVATTRYLLAARWSDLLFYGLIGGLLFIAPEAAKLSPAALTGYVFAALYMMNPTSSLFETMPIFLRGRASLAKIQEIAASLDSTPAETAGSHVSCAATPVRLELCGVTYSYPRRDGDDLPFSVGPIDLSFSGGEVVFVVGGNGSGKSTLVKLLTGLYAPEAGEIRLNGTPIGPADRDAYRENFAVVFSDYHLFDELFGIDTTTQVAQIQEYLQLLRLERTVQVRDGRFSSTALSAGQRKRLALLTAFLDNRPIYVFDEWAADQDPAYKEVFYRRVLPQLRSAGKCVVVVTHDDRYFHLGDRVVKLEAGQTVDEAIDGSAGNTMPVVRRQPKHGSFV